MALKEIEAVQPGLTKRERVYFYENKGDWLNLRQRAELTAELRPDIPNYVSLPWANKPESGQFDEEAQAKAARIVADGAFSGYRPDVVVGIGHSGIAFAEAVRRAFLDAGAKPDLEIIENLFEKDASQFKTQQLFTAHSYSRSLVIPFSLPDVDLTDARVLLVDDVSAQGSIGIAAEVALKAKGAKIMGFATYFAKDWQQGLERFTATTGVPSFSVIRIASRDDKHIQLTPELEASTRFVKNAHPAFGISLQA